MPEVAQASFDESVISLWQQAFGDSREDVEFFLNNCRNKICLCLKDGEKLLSMLFLVDCKVDSTDFKYIYAVCTDGEYRNNGFSTKLLHYCFESYDRLLLIPADNNLARFYYNRGFVNKIDIEKIKFDESEEVKEYLLEGCFLEKPFALSN